MARNDPQMNLRVPMDLKEKIEKAAFDNGRTITAEAVYRLEQSFEKNSNQNEVLQKMEELLQRLEKLENKGN